MKEKQHKYYVQTFGCQMNKNDSERVSSLLNSLDLEKVEKPEEADLIVVNTCSVRQSAEDRVFGMIKNWQKLRKEKPNLIIAVTGCMPGRDHEGKIKDKIPGVDLWFGIDSLIQLPKWLEGLAILPLSKGELEGVAKDYLQINPSRDNNTQVFISIQTGCDNFCTYCVVPHARGRERNRTLKSILKEIKIAVGDGAKEITLLGQVVNNYKASDLENFSKDNPYTKHTPNPSQEGNSLLEEGREVLVKDHFAALLWEINQIDGEFRIHFTAPDPQHFSLEQVKALSLPKQVNFLHIPVQSGDDEILKKMNRHYTSEEYIDLIKKIRKQKPDIAIATDIIVGFCDEGEKEFENTVKMYKECDFDISYNAKYSERSGTTAAKVLSDNVSIEDKKKRWFILQDLMEETTLRKNQKYLDKEVRVLVSNCEQVLPLSKGELDLSRSELVWEGVANKGEKANPSQPPLGKGRSCVCSGNSDEMKIVQFVGDSDMIGTFQKVKITQALMWILKGKLV